jgi:hypothetical protein
MKYFNSKSLRSAFSKIALIACVGFFVCLQTPQAHAAIGSVLIPCGYEKPGTTQIDECDFNDFVVLIRNVVNYLVIFTAPLAVIAFTYVGFILLTASDNPAKRQKAKQIAWMVLIGFIIVLSAWLIVSSISNQILKPEYNIKLFARKKMR